jgi:hypothetical protein
MKWIKTFESHRNQKEVVNEEFIGKLFGNLMKKAKQNISMAYSKNFGTAKKADAIINEYEMKAIEAQKEKLAPLKALAEYKKSVKAGGEVDKEEETKLQKNYEKQEELYKQRLEKLKELYNAKLDDVVEDEENKKIKNYIKIKKLEMEEQLLLNEIKLIQQEVGMTDDQIKDDPVFKNIMANLQKRAEDNTKSQEAEKKILDEESSEGGNQSSFDFEEAKKNQDYEGPLKNEKFGVGDEIKIYVRKSDNKDISTLEKDGDEYKGTTAFVFARQENDEESKLRVGYNKDDKENTFTIDKGRVITTKKLEDEKSEEKPEEETKQESEV